MKPKNILITGPPGCGKSTLIEKVVHELHTPVTGFVTREVRERGVRVGFSIDTPDGKSGTLAHVDIESPFRVGKYGVAIQILEELAVPSLKAATADFLIVIDEIGKMECLSAVFRKAVLDTLDSPNPVLASIAMKGDAFIEGLKARGDVIVMTINRANRDIMVHSVLGRIR